MNNKEILIKLQKIFCDIFDDEKIELRDEMTAEDIEDWDSLTHINLIHDIEAEFQMEFTTEEIISAKNVGEFIRIIGDKIE